MRWMAWVAHCPLAMVSRIKGVLPFATAKRSQRCQVLCVASSGYSCNRAEPVITLKHEFDIKHIDYYFFH